MNDLLVTLIGVAIAVYIQYWVIRLAVRGGIEDAAGRRRARVEQERLWQAIEARRATAADES
ncbi:MAG: hypothetical protein HOV79_08335 [Hamadaea sp.]|nr:hypothetical protein [Hamadaea sp.]